MAYTVFSYWNRCKLLNAGITQSAPVRRLVRSVQGSEVKGEVETLSRFDGDHLGLLLRLLHAGSDGVRPRQNINDKVLIWRGQTMLRRMRQQDFIDCFCRAENNRAEKWNFCLKSEPMTNTGAVQVQKLNYNSHFFSHFVIIIIRFIHKNNRSYIKGSSKFLTQNQNT